MPLFDHFAEPFCLLRPWGMLHSQWAGSIAAQLNASVLPAGYLAGPEIEWGRAVEIDVATAHRDREGAAEEFESTEGNVATATYAPPAARMRTEVEFAQLDVFEVRVMRESGGLTLVAAIELVSPSNKGRPAHREAFVRKSAAYLQSGVSVVVVDVVTERPGNLHAELLDAIGTDTERVGDAFDLYVASYRVVNGSVLEAWPEELRVGAALPALPLWIEADRAVPLALEESYLTACRSLRIKV